MQWGTVGAKLLMFSEESIAVGGEQRQREYGAVSNSSIQPAQELMTLHSRRCMCCFCAVCPVHVQLLCGGGSKTVCSGLLWSVNSRTAVRMRCACAVHCIATCTAMTRRRSTVLCTFAAEHSKTPLCVVVSHHIRACAAKQCRRVAASSCCRQSAVGCLIVGTAPLPTAKSLRGCRVSCC